jgi:hypothetical protein
MQVDSDTQDESMLREQGLRSLARLIAHYHIQQNSMTNLDACSAKSTMDKQSNSFSNVQYSDRWLQEDSRDCDEDG